MIFTLDAGVADTKRESCQGAECLGHGGHAVDQMPVFLAALLHTCTALLKEAEWRAEPHNTVCVMGGITERSAWT